MDDDLTFGASVWATNEAPAAPTPKAAATTVSAFDDVGFDDFDDEFGAPTEANEGDLKDDDDFGDFGDFGEVDAPAFTNEAQTFDDFRIPGPSSQNWRPLVLDPFPSRSSLEQELDETLGPIWDHEDLGSVTTDDPIREVEGAAQILITPSSREMYRHLLQTPPPTKPPNWTRSRIRRQHLIALGIPVNLDEVLPPRPIGKPLPILEIHTRPMSAPPGVRNQHQTNGSTSSKPGSRSGTPKPGERGVFAQFGPKPELEMAKINKLLALNTEQLTMQSLVNVERYLAEIKAQTANTSDLLTYLLQSRDALQQDSETYNGLIAEMVGQAQSLRSGKPRTPSIRRGPRE
ncbi:hypothetical protein CPB83DRAFT_802934 [Crepidotus variabilis]|uniref:Uncharacterized protein n=1 Tax=Crepidotus variabilis TaxID=179855 RepID=A0A9P6ETW4_9AGAR|nr:hypothetical protein CPB83DRAFT_802934 [Crepidotus variabilis]